jgi:hypothetical protein
MEASITLNRSRAAQRREKILAEREKEKKLQSEKRQKKHARI